MSDYFSGDKKMAGKVELLTELQCNYFIYNLKGKQIRKKKKKHDNIITVKEQTKCCGSRKETKMSSASFSG